MNLPYFIKQICRVHFTNYFCLKVDVQRYLGNDGRSGFFCETRKIPNLSTVEGYVTYFVIFLTFSFLALDKRSYISYASWIFKAVPKIRLLVRTNISYILSAFGQQRKDGAEIILTKMSANKGQNVNSIFLTILSKLKLMTSFLKLHLEPSFLHRNHFDDKIQQKID